MNSLSKVLLLVSCVVSTYSYGQENTTTQQTEINIKDNKSCCTGGSCCEGTQTPAGVMTDHAHPKGNWVVTYTYMNMMMQGNQIGASKASDNTIYQNYMMAPETMSMQMHMVMAMYGLTDKLTLMAMGGFAINNMSMNMSDAMMNMPGMVMAPGNLTMQSTSSGFTDTKLYGLYNFSNNEAQHVIGSIGIAVPTGTIKATGTTMLGDNQRLPYDMQTGSGSYSILPGITFVRNYDLFSYGADAGADIKLNTNSLGYKLGNVYHATAWASYKFLPFVSGSLRTEAISADKISGSDGAMNISVYQTDDPTTKTSNYGGEWVNVYAGLNFHFNQPALRKITLLTEFGLPIYQNLNGTQMAVHGNLLAGLLYAF